MDKVDLNVTTVPIVLTSPDGWPQMPPLTPEGELIVAYVNRGIIGDPFFQSVMAMAADVGLKTPSLELVHPADLTIGWWENKWPDGDLEIAPSRFKTARREALAYHRSRIFWRLVVELLDRLRADDLAAKGLRIDYPECPLQAVPPGLWRNPYMVLRPRAGRFCAERRHAFPDLPMGLPSFSELTLRSRSAIADAPAPADQRQKPTDNLVRQWMRDRVAGWPDDKVAPSEKEDSEAACRHFGPGLSRREVRIVRIR